MHWPVAGVRAAPLLVLAIAIAASGGVTAQHGSGDPTDWSHPTHIHTGRCPIPGPIVGPLTEVSRSVGVTVGSPGAIAVESSRSTSDWTLSELIATDHAVAVHLSYEQMEVIIACGDIGGPMRSAAELVIGLGSVGGSGYTGIAVLADAGAGMSVADVYIAMTTPGASPIAGPAPSPAPYPLY